MHGNAFLTERPGLRDYQRAALRGLVGSRSYNSSRDVYVRESETEVVKRVRLCCDQLREEELPWLDALCQRIKDGAYSSSLRATHGGHSPQSIGVHKSSRSVNS